MSILSFISPFPFITVASLPAMMSPISRWSVSRIDRLSGWVASTSLTTFIRMPWFDELIRRGVFHLKGVNLRFLRKISLMSIYLGNRVVRFSRVSAFLLFVVFHNRNTSVAVGDALSGFTWKFYTHKNAIWWNKMGFILFGVFFYRIK